ncbi:hypothetical protein PENTCL1PPCAC_7628, partial [Pristionchus entomophagus]
FSVKVIIVAEYRLGIYLADQTFGSGRNGSRGVLKEHFSFRIVQFVQSELLDALNVVEIGSSGSNSIAARTNQIISSLN